MKRIILILGACYLLVARANPPPATLETFRQRAIKPPGIIICRRGAKVLLLVDGAVRECDTQREAERLAAQVRARDEAVAKLVEP